jgi:hypothetical protein
MVDGVQRLVPAERNQVHANARKGDGLFNVAARDHLITLMAGGVAVRMYSGPLVGAVPRKSRSNISVEYGPIS